MIDYATAQLQASTMRVKFEMQKRQMLLNL